MLFLVGVQCMKKIKVNDVEQGQLVDNIFKQNSTSSTIPYFVEIAKFLTNVIPLICRSFRLMMKWYSVESIESSVAKSVDVEMIRHVWIFTSPQVKDLIQIRLITLIMKLLLAMMDVVLSSINGKSY